MFGHSLFKSIILSFFMRHLLKKTAKCTVGGLHSCFSFFSPISLTDKENIKKRVALRERGFGVMEGKPFTHFMEEAKKSGLDSPWKMVPEGGESEQVVYERAKKFVKVATYYI